MGLGSSVVFRPVFIQIVCFPTIRKEVGLLNSTCEFQRETLDRCVLKLTEPHFSFAHPELPYSISVHPFFFFFK